MLRFIASSFRCASFAADLPRNKRAIFFIFIVSARRAEGGAPTMAQSVNTELICLRMGLNSISPDNLNRIFQFIVDSLPEPFAFIAVSSPFLARRRNSLFPPPLARARRHFCRSLRAGEWSGWSRFIHFAVRPIALLLPPFSAAHFVPLSTCSFSAGEARQCPASRLIVHKKFDVAFYERIFPVWSWLQYFLPVAAR